MDKLARKDKKNIILTGITLTILGLILTIIGLSSSQPYFTGIGSILLIIGLLMAVPIKVLGHAGTIIGFFGMAFIFYILIRSTITLIFVEGAESTIAPVLPGVKIPGLPILSFWHWIISIFILALVHEFSHGILARVYKLKIKSSGIGFLGPILLAFVEPDEKQTAKAQKKAQLSMFAAGPFANIILAVLALLFSMFILAPLSEAIFDADGITVSNFTPGFPAEKSGLEVPFTIKSVNHIETLSVVDFVDATEGINPNQEIILNTDKGTAIITTIENPDNSSKGLIGIQGLSQKTKTKENISEFQGKSFRWISMLFMWLFFINLGVGLFNLLPLGPVDGGRMFHVATLKIFKNKKTAKKVWLFAMYLIIFLIIVNFIPWIIKLLKFITGLISAAP